MTEAAQILTRSKKATTITLAVVFTVSVSGFFMGMRQTVRETKGSQQETLIEQLNQNTDDDGHNVHSDVTQAVDYRAISQAGFGPNTHWENHLGNLAQQSPPELKLINSENLDYTREKREKRRAYDGAPPVVPHPIDQDTAASCLQCHAQPTRIDNVVAAAISHPVYSSCTQCHVSSKGLGPSWNTSDYDLHTGNTYSGYHQPTKGERAYPDAPPTIPHTVHMRQNCMSCHGPQGTSPIRTTHPERQSCVQCHVPSGSISKTNFAESPFPLVEDLLKQDAN